MPFLLFTEDAGGSAAAASGGAAAEPEAAAEDRGECARAAYDYQAGTCWGCLYWLYPISVLALVKIPNTYNGHYNY